MKTHRYECTDCGTNFVIAASDKTTNEDRRTEEVSWCPICESPLRLLPNDNAD